MSYICNSLIPLETKEDVWYTKDVRLKNATRGRSNIGKSPNWWQMIQNTENFVWSDLFDAVLCKKFCSAR